MQNGLKIVNLGVATLKNINLLIEPGQCVGLTGPSGIGKSLFLRALADLDPHEGEMWLDGVSSDQIAAPLWRRKVGLLPAESAWWYDTVGSHFAQTPDQWLQAVGLAPTVMTWQVIRLSSGERQRLALVRLLTMQPNVLLLDEPTANLDRENTKRVEVLLANIRQSQRIMIIWVSHDLAQLHRNCGPIYTVSNNQIVVSQNAQYHSDLVAL